MSERSKHDATAPLRRGGALAAAMLALSLPTKAVGEEPGQGEAGKNTASLETSAAEKPADPRRGEDPLAELEKRVWTSDNPDLHTLENRIVRQIQRHPFSARAHYLLSHTLVRIFSQEPGNLQILRQASNLAQQAIDLAPNEDYGYVAVADVMDLMGKGDRALQLLNQSSAESIEPSWRFYFARARLLSDRSDTDKVLSLLKTALSFEHAQREIIVPYVVAVLQAEKSGEALLSALADWHEKFPSPLFRLTMAITNSDLNRPQKAHEIYREILADMPGHREATVNDAVLLYQDLNQPARASKLLREVLDQGENLPASTESMINAHLGAAHLSAGESEMAEDEFLRAMKVAERDAPVLDFITRRYRGLEHPKQFAGFLNRINQEIPGKSVHYALLGETYAEELGNYDEALEAYNNAITLEPGRSDYYNGIGLTYYRKKKYDRALEAFKNATSVNPQDATAHYNQACMFSLLGERKKALGRLGEAFNLDPRLANTARTDSDLDNLRQTDRFHELMQRGLPPTMGSDSAISH